MEAVDPLRYCIDLIDDRLNDMAHSVSKIHSNRQINGQTLTEIDKLKKSMAKFQGLLAGIQGKLSNQGFLASAPAEVVQREKEKLEEFGSALERMGHYLKDLEA